MQTGISESDFWAMTPKEIRDTYDAYEKRIQEEMRRRAVMDHAYACMLGRMLDGQRISLYEAYPVLFKEEAQQQQLEIAKMRMIDFANHHNHKSGVKSNDR